MLCDGAPWGDETDDETHLVPELGNVTSHHPVLSTINLKNITINPQINNLIIS